MLTNNEMKHILTKAMKLSENHRSNVNLILEIALLKKELRHANERNYTYTEATILSCEYFANELSKTIAELEEGRFIHIYLDD